MKLTITEPKTKLIYLISISVWFAGVGLYPFIKGSSSLDSAVHLLGIIGVLVGLSAMAYLAWLTRGMKSADVRITWEKG